MEPRSSKTNSIDNGVENNINSLSLSDKSNVNAGEKPIQNGEGGVQTSNASSSRGTNGGRSEEVLGGKKTKLGVSEEGVGKNAKELAEITDAEEAMDLIDELLDKSDGNAVGNAKLGDLEGMRTFTNEDRNVIISINKDGEIVEFVKDRNVSRETADNLILEAVDKGANKVTVDSEQLINDFERLGFRNIARVGERIYDPSINKYRFYNKKIYMVHNGDPINLIKENLSNYVKDERLGWIKRFENEGEAIAHRDRFIRDNAGYSLGNIKGWNGSTNFNNFGNTFKSSSEVKDYITKKVKSLDNKATRNIEDEYNKAIAETMEIYNGHIDNSDLSLLYYDRVSTEEALGKFSRDDVILKVGEEDGFTIPHEYTHYNDFGFGKELVGENVMISQIANQIKKKKRPAGKLSKRAELIWDLSEIFNDIEEFARDSATAQKGQKGYTIEPREMFARFGEGFISFVKGRGAVSTWGEIYPKKTVIKYAEWLGKLDEARQKGELFDGTLEEGHTHYKKENISIPEVGTLRSIQVTVNPNNR